MVKAGSPATPNAARGGPSAPTHAAKAAPAARPGPPQPPRGPQQSKPGIAVATPPVAPRPASAPAWNRDGEPRDDDEPIVGNPLPVEARAATSSGSFTRDEIRALVRSAVDEAVTPLQHVLRDLEQRLADLEQRPRANSRPGFEGTMASTPAALAVQIAAAQAALPVAAAAPAPAVSPAAPSAPASAPHYASAMAPPASMAHVPAALAPRIDLAAIERNVKLDDADLAMIDGRRRKRRNALLLVFFLVLVFGGMFAMLARSYMHID